MNSISPLPPHPYTAVASVSVQVHDVEKNVESLNLSASNVPESKGQLLFDQFDKRCIHSVQLFSI